MKNNNTWKPSAPISNLLKRAEIVAKIRQFFNNRGLLEVETPSMSKATTTDVHLFSFQTRFIGPGQANGLPLFLTTSPEYHMKRLLAAGSGPIFQLCHSFRNEEYSRIHNPEFTMLEWYRPFYDIYQLMNEVEDLLQKILSCNSSEILSYQQVFMHYLGIDPLSVNEEQIYEIIIKLKLEDSVSLYDDKDTLLQLLFSMVIEPSIGHYKPVFIYHFPASQASLAAINNVDHRVADRFELYFKGIELANGFRELTNADEQRERFLEDNRKRASMNLLTNPIDENFLNALKYGIPECSGVALGVDRLIMLAIGSNNIKEVIAFSINQA